MKTVRITISETSPDTKRSVFVENQFTIQSITEQMAQEMIYSLLSDMAEQLDRKITQIGAILRHDTT